MAADTSATAGAAPRTSSDPRLDTDRELAEVYRAHHAFVRRSLIRLGVPEQRVADAVHDVFMVVARRLEEFEGRASIRTWLFAIAIRVARGLRRDVARERRRKASVEQASAGARQEPPDARVEAAKTLRDFLGRLDEEKRAVFIMAELEGMTAPEIAAAVGIKISTVYSRLRLARERLDRMVQRARARERGRAS